MVHTDTRIRTEDIRADHDHAAADGRSLTHLIKELRDETTTLMRQEVALAKTEMSEKMSRVGQDVTYLAIGGAIAFASVLLLLMALAAGLYVALVAAEVSHMTAGWLAPLIVGGVVALLGYILLQKGLTRLKTESLLPERTKESLIEDKEWVKEKVR